MEKKTFGTFLAQGAAGNAIATYVVLIGLVFYAPGMSSVIVVVLLPFYLLAAGIIGVPLGGFVWLAGRLFDRRLTILPRAAIGIVLPTLIVIVVSLAYGVMVDWKLLLGSISASLAYSLPATLVAGSRFHPLRTIVFGLPHPTTGRDFVSGFSFLPALMLRVGSLFGLLASALYMACLVAGVPGWGIRADFEAFLATSVAILYFAVTALVSFTSQRKFVVAATAGLANLPLLIWALDRNRYMNVETGFLAFVVWVFIYLWVLFVAGRMISSQEKIIERYQRTRILPLTLWEIQIRHALNRW